MFMTSQLNRWNSNQVTIYWFLIYECFWVNNLSISIFVIFLKIRANMTKNYLFSFIEIFFSECKSHTLLSITYVLYHNISLLSLNGQFNQNQYREYQIVSLSVFSNILSLPCSLLFQLSFPFYHCPYKTLLTRRLN